MVSKKILLDELKPRLKERRFRKTRTTWHREFAEVIAVFNMQTSQWDCNHYYINIGIYLKCLGSRKDPPEYECHVRTRLDLKEKLSADIVAEAMRWYEDRVTMAQVKKRAKADSRKGYVWVEAIEALK